jgi:hypothetical protein
MFFIYRGPDESRVPPLKGRLYLASEISLGNDLQNLPLVLGLLKDMVRVESSPYTSLNNVNCEV